MKQSLQKVREMETFTLPFDLVLLVVTLIPW